LSDCSDFKKLGLQKLDGEKAREQEKKKESGTCQGVPDFKWKGHMTLVIRPVCLYKSNNYFVNIHYFC